MLRKKQTNKQKKTIKHIMRKCSLVLSELKYSPPQRTPVKLEGQIQVK